MAALQLGALKTLSVILGANKFIELLLVPQLASDSPKSPTKCDVQTESKDSDLQVCAFPSSPEVLSSPVVKFFISFL